MSRHEQWDIVSSVGLTALVVAAGRAVDTHRADSLVEDPYAEAFVAAAAPSRPLPTRPDQGDGDGWQMMSGYMGVRSRFFDTFFADAGRAGIRQAVILAAGLDTRAHRLDWAPGSTVYEVDQPAVPSGSTCATTGPARSTRPAWTRQRRPPGSPRDCCPTSRPRPRTRCSTP